LEASPDLSDDVFKIGRSTGRLFKEKGVSLYKDKEISTTHSKIELRNGQAFLIDANSTNGTCLNNELMEALAPLRLKDGDVITLGSTELLVNITDMEDPQENTSTIC
jgi:pSer/pThr/pTyr-binding forkhead associated (FHA) protein